MSPVRRDETAPTTPRAGLGRTAAVLVPGSVLALLSTTVIGVAVPSIVSELDSSVSVAQWVSTAYLLASGVAIPVSGWAGVRFGVRSTWIVAIIVFTIGSIASAAASDIGLLIGARVLQGLGGGALEPLMLTTLAQLAGPRRIGRVMGATAAVMSLGPLIGASLGGVVVDSLSWRWIFGFTAVLAVLVAISSIVVLRRQPPGVARLDGIGLLLLALSTTLGLFGLSRGASPDGFDAIAVTSMLCAVASLTAFVLWARRRGSRAIVDLSTFSRRGFGLAVAIMTLSGAAIYPLLFGLPLYYQGVAGLDATTSGLLTVPYGLGTLVIMPLAGRLSDTISARLLVVAGAAIALLGFGGVLLTGAETAVWIFAVLSFVIGIGSGTITSPTVATLYRVLPGHLAPSGSTILFIVNQLGGALGVAVLTLLIGTGDWTLEVGTGPLWLPFAAVLAIAVIGSRLGAGGDSSRIADRER